MRSSIYNWRAEVSKEVVQEEEGAMCCRNIFFFFYQQSSTYVGLSLNICGAISLIDIWGMLQDPIEHYEDFNSDLGQLHQIAPQISPMTLPKVPTLW